MRLLRTVHHVSSESPCFSVILDPSFLDLGGTPGGFLGLVDLFDLLLFSTCRLGGLPAALKLLLAVLGDLLGEFTVHADLRTLSVEVVNGAGHEDGDDGEDRGGPFFGVFFADVREHRS